LLRNNDTSPNYLFSVVVVHISLSANTFDALL
jgi:hypothetical protein